MTVQDWCDQHPGEALGGAFAFVVPDAYRDHLPADKKRYELASYWVMPEDRRGFWVRVADADSDQIYPIFNVPVNEFFEWEVVERADVVG